MPSPIGSRMASSISLAPLTISTVSALERVDIAALFELALARVLRQLRKFRLELLQARGRCR